MAKQFLIPGYGWFGANASREVLVPGYGSITEEEAEVGPIEVVPANVTLSMTMSYPDVEAGGGASKYSMLLVL